MEMQELLAARIDKAGIINVLAEWVDAVTISANRLSTNDEKNDVFELAQLRHLEAFLQEAYTDLISFRVTSNCSPEDIL